MTKTRSTSNSEELPLDLATLSDRFNKSETSINQRMDVWQYNLASTNHQVASLHLKFDEMHQKMDEMFRSTNGRGWGKSHCF
jgi:hypothetical protein